MTLRAMLAWGALSLGICFLLYLGLPWYATEMSVVLSVSPRHALRCAVHGESRAFGTANLQGVLWQRWGGALVELASSLGDENERIKGIAEESIPVQLANYHIHGIPLPVELHSLIREMLHGSNEIRDDLCFIRTLDQSLRLGVAIEKEKVAHRLETIRNSTAGAVKDYEKNLKWPE